MVVKADHRQCTVLCLNYSHYVDYIVGNSEFGDLTMLHCGPDCRVDSVNDHYRFVALELQQFAI